MVLISLRDLLDVRGALAVAPADYVTNNSQFLWITLWVSLARRRE
jgi:hypothetical protein